MLPANSKLELPLWIGVAMSQRNVVELKKPPYLTQNFFNSLSAGPSVVTMAKYSMYIYEVTLKLVELFPVENVADIMDIFLKAYIKRFNEIILDHSTNARESDTQSQATKRLSMLERELFELHKNQRLKFMSWVNKKTLQVQVNYDFMDQETKERMKRFKAN